MQLIAILLVYLGPVSWEGEALVRDLRAGRAPWSLGGFALLLFLVPPLCWRLGGIVWRGEPARLLRLLLGFELPLLGLCTLRLFRLHELSPAHLQVMGTLFIGALFCLYELLRGPPQPSQGRVAVGLQLSGQTLGFVGAAYWLVVLLPPALMHLGRSAAEPFQGRSASWVSRLLAAPLLLCGALLFLLAPFILVRIYARSLRTAYGVAKESLGSRAARLLPAAIAVGSLALFLTLNRQPQNRLVERIAQPPRSNAERLALLRDSEALRPGFLNAYLSEDRYLGPTVPGRLSPRMREELLHHLTVSYLIEERAHELYGALARPFLYDNECLDGQPQTMAALYADFFDAPIWRAEQASIVAARTARLLGDQRRDHRRAAMWQGVRRSLQEVQATRHGDLAQIELHEVYESTRRSGTVDVEADEILLYFALPESAVITGLWLGESADRSQALEFLVAARHILPGALPNTVQRKSELLEQIGPRQYRLRIRAWLWPALWSSSHTSAVPRHLWLRYSVLSDGTGFPLPQRLLERNVYDTPATKKILEGRELARGEDFPVRLLGAEERVAHEELLDMEVVRAQPVERTPQQGPTHRTLAVLLDRSRSMSQVQSEAEAALRALRELASKNDLDFYLTSAPNRGEPTIRIDEPAQLPDDTTLFFGRDRLDRMLREFDALKGPKRYDGVLLLTDAESLDSTQAERADQPSGPPLWIVHLGGRLAPGYSDAVHLAIVRSGGGVTTDLGEALSAIERTAGGSESQVIDGYLWTGGSRLSFSRLSRYRNAFTPLAAGRLIRRRAATGSSGWRADPASLNLIAVLEQVPCAFSLLAPFDVRSGQLPSPFPGFERSVASGDNQLAGSDF